MNRWKHSILERRSRSLGSQPVPGLDKRVRSLPAKIMKKFAYAFAAGLALVAPAAAAPPPLPVAITFLPGSRDTETLREVLIEQNWFGRVASTLDPAAVRACTTEACVRALTEPTKGKGPPEVVVLMTAEAGRTRFVCIGPGAVSRSAERQSVVIDLAAAIDPDPVRGALDRRSAAGCIISAAAESGW